MTGWIEVQVAATISAPLAVVYGVIADYREGHQRILPRPPFEVMTVRAGGYGAGTELETRLRVMGQVYVYEQQVTEPDPGHVLRETDVNTGEFSEFRLEANGSQTQVTIYATFADPGGWRGQLKRWFHPMIVRGMFRRELANLADYVVTLALEPEATPDRAV